VDADVQTAAKRLNKDLDRMEQKGQEYHKKVREGFLQLAKQYNNISIVDGTEEIENVHKQVVQALQDTL
jgi:dTMP kinase